jgi:hypothetical protein
MFTKRKHRYIMTEKEFQIKKQNQLYHNILNLWYLKQLIIRSDENVYHRFFERT